MERIERIMLYVIVLILAGVVAWPLLEDQERNGPGETGNGPGDGDCVDCEGLEQRLKAIDSALGGLDKTVTDAVGRSLEGLEGRIADAVSKKLLAEGCQLTKTPEECVGVAPPTLPPLPPIKVNSKFTFLYQNARLNEDGEIARDSVGVKLTQRHLKRLERLTKALQPCRAVDAPVEFEVAGYSSTADFLIRPDGSPMDNSDELNRKTANLRAQIVVDYLEEQGFQVNPTQPSGDLQRPYVDDAQPGVDQQALNRTVLIELKSAGTCDLGESND